jgi:hypothetical protein
MRLWHALFVAALLVLPGCTLLDRAPAPAVAPKLRTAGEPPIRPDEITPANARDQASRLNEELDRDMDGEF